MSDFSEVPGATLIFPVALPRHVFGPRLIARAGEVWRAMQDVVVDQSSSVGWTADRYVAANTMFVVRTMTVLHASALKSGDSLTGRTWPSRARRQMLFTRQVRLFGKSGLVAAATQEWAYLSRELAAIKAGQDIYDAFQIYEGHPDVELPEFVAETGHPTHRFGFTTWHGWMDPHGHVNHAAYVDYCDEGLSRMAAAEGKDPQLISPVAESVHFRAAITAGADVTVESTRVGRVGDAVVHKHRIVTGDTVCATATTVRK